MASPGAPCPATRSSLLSSGSRRSSSYVRGPPSTLSPEAEEIIFRFIGAARRHHSCATVEEVKELAADLEKVEASVAGREPRWPGGMASLDWWRGFKRRFPTVTLTAAQQQDGDRTADSNADSIHAWFAVLATALKDPKYRDEVGGAPHMYNMDECPLNGLGRTSKAVVEARNLKGTMSRRTHT